MDKVHLDPKLQATFFKHVSGCKTCGRTTAAFVAGAPQENVHFCQVGWDLFQLICEADARARKTPVDN